MSINTVEMDRSEVNLSSLSDIVSSTVPNEKSLQHCKDILPEEELLQQLLRKGILETSKENIASRVEILPLLSKLNLEPQTLPNDIKDGLQKIASILRHEKLSDFNDVTLSIVMERKKIEEKKRQHEEKQLALQYNDVYRKYLSFSKKFNCLQEAVISLEDFVEDAQKKQEDSYCNSVSLFTKLKEYHQTVEKLEKDLTDMQIEDLYPNKILNKYNKYLEISGELAELNQWLNRYEELPPNLLQAKALVEIKRKEYESLQKELLKKTNY